MPPSLGCTLAEGIQDIFLSAGMMKLLVQIFTHLSVSDSRKLFLLYSTTVMAKAVSANYMEPAFDFWTFHIKKFGRAQ